MSVLIQLDEIKQYLRVDSSDDDALIQSLLESATKLCLHVARIKEEEISHYESEFKTAVLYAIAYLYEHREEANHRDLTLTLRSLLFGVRKEAF